MRPLCNAVSCSVGQMQVSQPIFLISFGRIKRHHAGLAGWGLSLERKGAAGSRIDGIYGIAPNVGCPTRKNLKDKAYPSKTKTNCPNKTKPAFVTALTGRKGSGVEAVTQLLFQCRSACADFAFPSCKAELKKPLTRKLWYSRQIFPHALSAQSPLWLWTDLNLQALIPQVFVY